MTDLLPQPDPKSWRPGKPALWFYDGEWHCQIRRASTVHSFAETQEAAYTYAQDYEACAVRHGLAER